MIGGTVDGAGYISATLSGKGKLTGTVSCTGGLAAVIDPIPHLYGSISSVAGLSGRLSGTPMLSGAITLTASDAEPYTGAYEISPSVSDQVLPVRSKKMVSDLIVSAIPYYETSNPTGTTIYIGG